MSNYLTIRGFASSPVELATKDSGLVIGKFRMGSNDRVLDHATNEWGDGPTNWYRINTFRTLAGNVAASIKKGDRIIVTGKLKISTFTKADGGQGMSVEIDADSVGADLKFGTCSYHRNPTQRTGPQPQQGDQTPYDAGTPGSASYSSAGVGSASSTIDLDAHGDMDDDGDDDSAAEVQGIDGDTGPVDGDPDSSDSGLGDGESVNEETGELVKDGDPF